jgi:hypothetical protein
VPHHIKGTLVTRAAAARRLGWSVYLVDKAVRDGELIELHCGRKRWITVASIDRLIDRIGTALHRPPPQGPVGPPPPRCSP